MFIICFDFGLKNIGIAIGQTVTKTANPILCINVKNNNSHWYNIKKLFNLWLIKKVVVGRPCVNHIEDKYLIFHIKKFVSVLKMKFHVQVFYSDESFTSCFARSCIKENYLLYNSFYSHYDIHTISAVLILERWLNLNY